KLPRSSVVVHNKTGRKPRNDENEIVDFVDIKRASTDLREKNDESMRTPDARGSDLGWWNPLGGPSARNVAPPIDARPSHDDGNLDGCAKPMRTNGCERPRIEV